jgi:hypothetical protein
MKRYISGGGGYNQLISLVTLMEISIDVDRPVFKNLAPPGI